MTLKFIVAKPSLGYFSVIWVILFTFEALLFLLPKYIDDLFMWFCVPNSSEPRDKAMPDGLEMYMKVTGSSLGRVYHLFFSTWNVVLADRLVTRALRTLELSRAHTPYALSICRFLHRDRPVMLTISTSPVVGMVDGRGYDCWQETLFVTFVDRA